MGKDLRRWHIGFPDQCGGPPESGLYWRNSPPTACVPRAGSPGSRAPGGTPLPSGWLSCACPASGACPATPAGGPDASPVDCGPVSVASPCPGSACACLAALLPGPCSPGRALVGLVSSHCCI